MRCTTLACVAVALIVPLGRTAAGPQTANLGVLQGVVVRGATDQPVPNVSIRLTRSSADLATTTDNLGRFVFKDLAPGEWSMLLESNGYVRRLFPDGGTPLKVDGNQSLGLTVSLTPTGAVSGRLIDRSGQPVGDVPVRLLDESNVQQEIIVRSNDRGEYRFYFLTPGKYRLTAGGTTTGIVRPNSAATRFAEEFDLVYYPGGNDRAFAQLFDVKAGEEVSGMNMVLGEGHAPTVRSVNATPAVPQPGNESAPQSPRAQ